MNFFKLIHTQVELAMFAYISRRTIYADMAGQTIPNERFDNTQYID